MLKELQIALNIFFASSDYFSCPYQVVKYTSKHALPVTIAFKEQNNSAQQISSTDSN
jgi:hypothetical protein